MKKLEASEEYAYDHSNYIDTEKLENGNYFNDENLTKKYSKRKRAEQLKYQLRRFRLQLLNGGISIYHLQADPKIHVVSSNRMLLT